MTLIKTFAAAGLSVAVLAGSLVPAAAMPLSLPGAPSSVRSEAVSSVINVQYRRGWYHGHRGYRDYRPGYRHYDGYWFPLAAFGAGALIGGAIAAQPRYVEPSPYDEPIYVEPAPTYVEPAPVYVAPAPTYAARGDINPSHYEWCSARYRSYDSYSNTFQPNYGPRRPCYSPYY